MLAIGYGCGLRRSELAGLDLADWHPTTRELVVRRGKGNKSRTCYLGTDEAVRDVRAWIRTRGRHRGGCYSL